LMVFIKTGLFLFNPLYINVLQGIASKRRCQPLAKSMVLIRPEWLRSRRFALASFFQLPIKTIIQSDGRH